MTIYASTFISGLHEPVRDALKEQISDISIISLYDGLIIYSTGVGFERIKKLKFLNNTFLVLKLFMDTKNNTIENMIQCATKMNGIEAKLSSIFDNKKYSYRIVTSKENQLVSVNDYILKSMEKRLSRVDGLYLNRHKPDLEFWFLLRSENIGLFMLRLTKRVSNENTLNRGELRPELCNILCSISGANKDDIILDPFCGYGSIPIERAYMFKYNMIFAADNDRKKVRKLKQRVKKIRRLRNKNFFVKHLDALDMPFFEDAFIDKIITDPPWGIYKGVGMDIEIFYGKMMKEMYRVLKPNGVIVILTAKKDELERVILEFKSKLKILKKYDILVSGKKASIYKILKES